MQRDSNKVEKQSTDLKPTIISIIDDCQLRRDRRYCAGWPFPPNCSAASEIALLYPNLDLKNV